MADRSKKASGSGEADREGALSAGGTAEAGADEADGRASPGSDKKEGQAPRREPGEPDADGSPRTATRAAETGLDDTTELAEEATAEDEDRDADAAPRSTRQTARELYYGDSRASVRFRYGLLVFDVVTIAFFVVTTITETLMVPIDLAIGVVLLADFATRLWISTRPRHFLTRWSTIGDIVVLVAVFGSVLVSDLAFLRILRVLRIFRSYHLARELKERFRWYRRNDDIVQSATNLFVFIFVCMSLVYVVEADTNKDIDSYLDALYFTMATLTTTGFGDIVVTDDRGKMLAVIIMVLGVALFLRLIQTVFRPTKVHFRCPTCGLSRHDPDAVHCKHCGELVNIPTKGEI